MTEQFKTAYIAGIAKAGDIKKFGLLNVSKITALEIQENDKRIN